MECLYSRVSLPKQEPKVTGQLEPAVVRLQPWKPWFFGGVTRGCSSRWTTSDTSETSCKPDLDEDSAPLRGTLHRLNRDRALDDRGKVEGTTARARRQSQQMHGWARLMD